MLPVELKVYAGPNIAVGVVQPPNKQSTNNPKIFLLIISITPNLIHFEIQLKVELKQPLEMLYFNCKFN